MTLDPTQILILVLVIILILDAIKGIITDVHVWGLINTLVGNQRASSFPVPPVVPIPPIAPPVEPVVVPPIKPPVVPDQPPVTPPVTPPVPPVPTGPAHVWKGKCSWFGGPNDKGSGDPNEGLALVSAVDISKFQDVLLPGAHGDALFRQLNPDTHYIACRWDYKETPRSYLQEIHIPVKNPANGKVAADVRAVDWGPNAKTGRVADLSPGLMSFLGLKTDGIVEVDVPLPGGGPTELPQPSVGGTVLQHNVWPTQAECPSFYGASEATIRANLVSVHVPWLMNGKTQTIEIHKKCANSLTRVVNFIWEQCGKSQDQIHKFGYDIFEGSFNWRVIAGTGTPSVHSYAAAIDFNAAANPQHATNTKFKSDSLITQAFETEGWIWGGRWSVGSVDAMHFQAARVR